MRLRVLSLALGLTAVTTSATRLTFKQHKQRPTFERRGLGASDLQTSVLAAEEDSSLDLNTVHDLIYIADINVGGANYPVQLDTGSSDLWIQANATPLAASQHTNIACNLTYGIGWVAGNISYAPVTFANLSVSSQAYLDVTDALNPALGYGAKGIAGLGFTSLSTIDAFVNRTGAASGRSLLYNMFQLNPKEPNFISFALQRSTEADDEVEGSFTIGEYEPKYAEVADRPAIPTWPPHAPSRWNVLLDAVIVNHANTTIALPSTDVVGAPTNKAVILMDSGSSYTYVPKAIGDKIYGGIPNARYDSSSGQWSVPCDFEIDMALQMGGQVFPIHPLDVTLAGLPNDKTCAGTFVSQNVSVGSGEFDILIGDNFLRSVYTVYDFGDFDENGHMGDPYIKLLSVIDPVEASADFHQARGGQAKNNITYTGLDGAAIMPSFSLSRDTESTIERIGQFLPAMMAIVALNALVLLILAIAGVVVFCRRRRPAARARAARGRMSPMPMNPRHSYVVGSGLPPPPNQSHVYEPVSMALTEDTFVPPSPAFHSFEGKRGTPGDRPKSIA